MDDTTEKKLNTQPFNFSGSAGEYFGILFVNGLLNAITLGLYSPWAKVRALQYLYGNTELAGGEFQFTADPKKMLISRIIALGLFITFIFVENVGTKEAIYAYVAMIVAFLVASPIITVFVMSFRLRYSRWRGVNFNFNKDYAGAYRVYLAPLCLIGFSLVSLYLPFHSQVVEETIGMERYKSHIEVNIDDEQERSVDGYDDAYNHAENGSYEESLQDEYTDSSLDEEYDEYDTYSEEDEEQYVNPYFFIPSALFFLIFILLVPYFDFINMRFLSRNVRFGNANFTYRASASDFYKIYGTLFLGLILLFGLWVGSAVLDVTWIAVIATILFIPFSKAFIKSKRYNLVIGKTTIDNDKFKLKADVPFGKMLFVLVTNTLGVILSFGLLRAWAYIRTVRLLLDHTAVQSEHSFDDFVAHQNEQLSAIGEELADAFDIDVAF